MAVPAAIAKAAAMLLTNEKTRKGVGWILVAVFSPVILLIALLLSLIHIFHQLLEPRHGRRPHFCC